jgi:energy-coupling factor transporter ATP-binding protein EcfA2
MSRIRRLELRGYRTFPAGWGDSIDLGDKRHLLLHGDNGSGKSSLGLALRDLLDTRTEPQGAVPFAKVRNVFDDPAFTGGHVTLHFDDVTPPLTWTYASAMAGQFRPTHILWDAMSRSAAWMDYQRLRRLYEGGSGEFLEDIFPLCFELLLVDVPLTETNPTCFSTEWQEIRKQAAVRRPTGAIGARALARVRARIAAFNTAFKGFVEVWQKGTNRLLARFVDSTQLIFDPPTDAAYDWVSGTGAGWRIRPPKLRLRLRYRDHEPPNPLAFLNESRLTACGLALWLAALLRTRPHTLAPGQTYPRVLVLDDLLLSLDMDHRIPLVEMLKEQFSEWQVFLLTHDAGWFEIAKSYLPEWSPVELFSRSDGARDYPALRPSTDFLTRAEQHLATRDYKATGVYLRSAFELMLRDFAEKHHLLIKYADRRKDLTTDDFWPQIEKQATKAGEPIVPEPLAAEVRRCRTHVLNPLCHDADHRPLQTEVRSALSVLRALRKHLVRDPKPNGEKARPLAPLEWANAEILQPPFALDPFGSGLALRCAFHSSIARLCHKHQVPVPFQRIRDWPNTAALWKALLADPRDLLAADPALRTDLNPFLVLFLQAFDREAARSKIPTFYFQALAALCGPIAAPPVRTRFDVL